MPLTPLDHHSTFASLVAFFIGYVQLLIPLFVGVIILLIFYAGFRYAYKADEKGPEREALLWGIIALFVIVSVWGLVRILCVTFFNNGSCHTSSSYTIGGSGGANSGGVIEIKNR